ncbi:unnamed protein product [Caenorhabditis nigoni]
MKSCLGWPEPMKKDSAVHYDVPHGVTYKVPKEIIQSFPSEHQYNAALVLNKVCYSRYVPQDAPRLRRVDYCYKSL